MLNLKIIEYQGLWEIMIGIQADVSDREERAVWDRDELWTMGTGESVWTFTLFCFVGVWPWLIMAYVLASPKLILDAFL